MKQHQFSFINQVFFMFKNYTYFVSWLQFKYVFIQKLLLNWIKVNYIHCKVCTKSSYFKFALKYFKNARKSIFYTIIYSIPCSAYGVCTTWYAYGVCTTKHYFFSIICDKVSIFNRWVLLCKHGDQHAFLTNICAR